MSSVLDTNADSRRRVVDGRVVRQLWAHPLGRVFAREDRMLTVLEPTVSFGPGGALSEATLRQLKRLRGDAIVSVTDIKESVGGRVVAETELVDATPLSQLLQSGRLEPSRALGILRQVARALAQAHRAGLSHGALSTTSVLLSVRDGRPDAVRVADFGLGDMSWAEHERDASSVPCSPERTLGLARGPSEDIYLFGCVAFVTLAGTPVFEGDAETVRRQHAIEDAPRIRRTEGGRHVPRPLANFLATCLAKDSEDRFADGDELEAALCEAQIDSGIATAWDDLPLPRIEPSRARAIERGFAALPQKEQEQRVRRKRSASGVFVAAEPAPEHDAQGAPSTAVPRDHTPIVETELASVVRHVDEIGRPEPVDRERDATPVAAMVPVRPRTSTIAMPTPPVPLQAEVARVQAAPEAAPRRGRGGIVMGLSAVLVAAAAGGWLAMRDRVNAAATTSDDGTAVAAVGAPDPDREPTADAREPGQAPAEEAPDDHSPDGATPSESDTPADEAPARVEPPASDRSSRSAPPGTKARSKSESSRKKSEPPPEPAPSPAQSVGDLLGAAKAAAAKGDRKEAERLYGDVLARDADHLGALDALGALRFNRGDYRGAAKVLVRAVDKSPKNAELRIRLGDAHFKLQQYDKARVQFAKAKALGHSAADRRLERTDAALGE